MPPLILSPEQRRQLLTAASYEILENLRSETLENLQSKKAPENQLGKFQHANNLLTQVHLLKKSNLLLECELETEKVKRKHYSSLQKEESTLAQGLMGLVDSYRKLNLNQSPAQDAEPACILGTEGARGLQAKMPALTSMQDEPTNAERAATLDASAAWDLQLEMPPLTLSPEQRRQLVTAASYEILENLRSETLEDLQSKKGPENQLGKFQRANNLLTQVHLLKKSNLLLECELEIEKVKRKHYSSLQKEESTLAQGLMGLIDSYRKLYLNQSPAQDAEPAGMLGTEAARGLQAKMPPLTSMQDEPTNAERAATLDASAAWDLPLEMPPLTLLPEQRRQLVTAASYDVLENLRSETLEDLQSKKAPENQLEKFQRAYNLLMQVDELKKSNLLLECELKHEKMKRKLYSSLQKEESTLAQGLMGLIDSYRKLIVSYRKLYLNQSPAQGTFESPAIAQPLQSSSAAQRSSP